MTIKIFYFCMFGIDGVVSSSLSIEIVFFAGLPPLSNSRGVLIVILAFIITKIVMAADDVVEVTLDIWVEPA